MAKGKASYFIGKQLIKKVAGTDPIYKNQFNPQKKSNVCQYHLGSDTNGWGDQLREFLVEGVNKLVLVKDNIEGYMMDVQKRLTPYKEFYDDHLDTFFTSCKEILQYESFEIDGVKFKSNDTQNRIYFTFKKDDDPDGLTEKLDKAMLGKITIMQFQRNDDTLFLKLYLVANIQKELCSAKMIKNKLKLPEQNVIATLEDYQKKYENEEEGIIKFSYDYSLFIKNDLLNVNLIENYSKYKNIVEAISSLYDEISIDDNFVNDEPEDEDNSKASLKLRSDRVTGGYNKIYYGIPGSGKSYSIDQFIKSQYSDEELLRKNVIRTTFYQDYTNSDFVGQLVPGVDSDGNITYVPNFGPFAKALKRAYDTKNMVYLVIEELNRGNAAAIFGDLFQLLDRLDENKAIKRRDGSKAGDSEYPISNDFLERYLNIPQGQVIIPSNLTILATMNTSDQNVFTLDTAFQRRWKKHKVEDDANNSKYADYFVPNLKNEKITWSYFVDSVNKYMLESNDNEVTEDKQIGPYFVIDDVLVEDQNQINDAERAEEFNHKVIEYLWSDVARFERDQWFKNKENSDVPVSYDQLIKEIDNYGISEIITPIEAKDIDNNQDESHEQEY